MLFFYTVNKKRNRNAKGKLAVRQFDELSALADVDTDSVLAVPPPRDDVVAAAVLEVTPVVLLELVPEDPEDDVKLLPATVKFHYGKPVVFGGAL